MDKEKMVTSVLIKLGNRPCNKGFEFLRSAVMQCIAERSLCRELSRGLYPRIAGQYGTSPAAVERNVRFTINTSWARRDRALAEAIFGNMLQSENDIPTNSVYISMLSEWAAYTDRAL